MRTLELEQGSLLLMSGALQHHWRHRLPKLATAVGPRVNVTFRNVVYSQPKSAVVG
ncbi:MAG: alkylated DNA repair dioxygenase AlkB [Porticoccus sp.]|jgi:alkylated DNA repair dioxygenase AlkB